MKEEINTYLSKVMGYDISTQYNLPDFSTWEGFGLLWEWARKQEWWKREFSIKFTENERWVDDMHINPEKFAMAIYNFLKNR